MLAARLYTFKSQYRFRGSSEGQKVSFAGIQLLSGRLCCWQWSRTHYASNTARWWWRECEHLHRKWLARLPPVRVLVSRDSNYFVFSSVASIANSQLVYVIWSIAVHFELFRLLLIQIHEQILTFIILLSQLCCVACNVELLESISRGG